MEKIKLHPEFKEFLKLLNLNKVDYLVVGGYAVGHYGYPRATGELDIWIARTYENAKRLAQAVVEFGKRSKTERFAGHRKSSLTLFH